MLENRRLLGILSIICFIFISINILLILIPYNYISFYYNFINNFDFISWLYESIYYISIIILIYLPPLFVLTKFDENKNIKSSKKLFKISFVLIGIFAIIYILISFLSIFYLFHRFSEGASFLLFIMIGVYYQIPLIIFGFIYLVALVKGILGFFKSGGKEYIKSNKWVFIMLFIIVFFLISCILYNTQDVKSKRILYSTMKSLPIYSNTNECESLVYSSGEIKGDWSRIKYYTLSCKYSSKYSLNETFSEYRKNLINKYIPYSNMNLEKQLLNINQSDAYKLRIINKKGQETYAENPTIIIFYNNYPEIIINVSMSFKN